MEEEKEEKFSIGTEELKNETVETAKKIKESVKETKIKEETKATKNFVIEMLKKPLEKIKEVATDSTGKFFKTVIFLIIVWTIVVLIDSTYFTIHYWKFSRIFNKILSVLKEILAPIIGILVYSVIVLVLNKKNKKSLTTVISTITITQLPLMLAAVAVLLATFNSKITIITSPFVGLCEVISIIFNFFGIKYLFDEADDNIFIRKYIRIQVIYYITSVVISLLGIYIY